MGQEWFGIAFEPLDVKLALLGHQHRFDVADVLGAVEHFLEDNEVFGGVNPDHSPFQVAFRTSFENSIMEGMPGQKNLGSDALAGEHCQVSLAAKVAQDGVQIHRTRLGGEMPASGG